MIVFSLQIFYFLFKESIEGENFVDLYFWVWICERRRLRFTDTIIETVLMFFMFFEKVNIFIIFICRCWLNSDYNLRVIKWRLIEIIAVIYLNGESFLMADVRMMFLFRLIIELFKFNKLSFRETCIVSWGRWGDRAAIKFERMCKICIDLHFSS